METIFGFPVSIGLILGVSLVMLWTNPENTLAKGIANLSSVMLVIAVGFTINIFLPENMVTLGLIATFSAAILLFIRAIELIKWKTFFLLAALWAIAVAVAAFIINAIR